MVLSWYFNRLRAMGPAEIVHRFGEKAKKTRARRRLEGWERYELPGPLPVLPGLAGNLAAAPAPLRQEIAEAARFILSGHFSALGVEWPQRDISNQFLVDIWRLDPVTGGLWAGSDTYCFDIPYRHERKLGDIKYAWEFNRLQFLQPVAAYAGLTGDRNALDFIETAVSSWYRANPPFRGLGWNSGIELGLRAISLLVVASLCGTSLSTACITQLRALLHAHQVWMSRYPSRFSSANNHLVAEAAGEFLIALAMPELPLSPKLEAKGRRILAEEANKQILNDGVGAEQSPTYAAFTAEFILLCSFVARATGKPVAPHIDERLKLLSNYIAWLSNEDGRVPGICDDDEGRVLTLARHEPAYAASVCAAIAGYLGEPPAGPRPPEADLRDALFGSAATGAAAPSGLKTFADGGYTIIREKKRGRDLGIVFDHAPLGYLAIAAHGHADALSVLVTIDGKPVFVDPGTYLYHAGAKWREWFRGTRAHNTLNIDGADQSIMSGPFNWSHKAVTTLEAASGGEAWSVTAMHDGYEKRFGMVHRRMLFSTEDGFAIRDELAGTGSRTAEIVFQLSPECDAHLDNGNVQVTRDGETIATMSWQEPGDIAIKAGGEVGEGGWYSPAFGIKVEAKRISWRGTVPPQGVTCSLSIGKAN
ncbi:heparinase II/III family protein [Pararhizobium sp. BT-229]|uniref:heparinase II/III family protein n=1 Tax=Pararhizobium sp. BT-229 TaxID=2986923 RepID=UPI0021F71E75|nr:alginate lyase family protein [Pararhizobium sp. BT-229]MCV9965918.1 heparinase II/III family protein [Pararhizobium sp. BT-229]